MFIGHCKWYTLILFFKQELEIMIYEKYQNSI